MKSYKEIAESVMRRRDEIAKERQRRRRMLISAGGTLCLAAFIGVGAVFFGTQRREDKDGAATAGMGRNEHIYVEFFDPTGELAIESGALWELEDCDIPKITGEIFAPTTEEERGGMSLVDRIDSGAVGTGADWDTVMVMTTFPMDTETPGTKPKDPSRVYPFFINIITGEATPAYRYYDPALHREETRTAAELSEYFGVDLTALGYAMPPSLEYNGGDSWNFLVDEAGETAKDVAHFVYGNEDGGRLTLSASRVLLPYDCIYSGSEVASEFVSTAGQRVNVMIYAGDFSEEKDGYSLLVADFQHLGVNYRVKLEGLYNPKLLDSVIKAILDR